MPDISKINALAIGSVGKVDGLAKASILDIDGISVPLAVSAPSGAYSVRLMGSALGISSYTGPAMRVRRETAGGAGDDDEADVAFDTSLTDPAISLDSAISNASVGVTALTLGEFLNVGTVGGTSYFNRDSLTVTASCFVDEWKDQSGNANHASNSTQGEQPQIHSGTVNTDLIQENGIPAVQFSNSANNLLYFTAVDLQNAGAISSVSKLGTSTLLAYLLNQDTPTTTQDDSVRTLNGNWIFNLSTKEVFYNTASATRVVTVNGTSEDGNTPSALSQQHCFQSCGSRSALADPTFKFSSVGARFLSRRWNGTMQEIVIWDVEQATNRTGIENDVNGFFSIYP